jgi:hypothetical protein
MKRHHFLLLAGILASLFGLSMVFAPAQLLANMTTDASAGAALVLRWMGCVLVSVGVINILARDDAGSPALMGVMVGNVLVHALGLIVDLVDYATGFIRLSGIVMGSVVHVGLLVGFLYYLRKATAAPARVAV